MSRNFENLSIDHIYHRMDINSLHYLYSERTSNSSTVTPVDSISYTFDFIFRTVLVLKKKKKEKVSSRIWQWLRYCSMKTKTDSFRLSTMETVIVVKKQPSCDNLQFAILPRRLRRQE